MNLYEKITEVLKANGLREKDIVMAYAYTDSPKRYFIMPKTLKETFSKQVFEDIDWESMNSKKHNFAIFGLDYQTQKAWILGIMGDSPKEWKLKKEMDRCKEFYKTKLGMQLYVELKKRQAEELVSDIRNHRKHYTILSAKLDSKISKEDLMINKPNIKYSKGVCPDDLNEIPESNHPIDAEVSSLMYGSKAIHLD